MKNRPLKLFNKGFTALELIVVCGIAILLAGLSIATFVSLSDYQSLDKNVDVIISYLQKARNQTINSKDDDQYGLRFASTSVTLFQGTSYNAASTTNLVYDISSKVALSSLSLTGGTTTVYFLPITGKPSATGTAVYRLNNSASTTKTIIIYGSGLVETQ